MKYLAELHFLQSIALRLEKYGEELQAAHGKSDFSTKTSEYDVLTELDEKLEKGISVLLAEFDPAINFVGEETGGDRTSKKYWLVDPLDGTIHFVRGMPFCTVQIALIEGGEPVASLIYNWHTKEAFTAAKGHGAFLNGQPISVSDRSPQSAVVLLELGPKAAERGARAEAYRSMNLLCAGYEFTLVARGTVEARLAVDPRGKDYDFAAGILLVSEAGGVVKRIEGQPYRLDKPADFLVASSEEIYKSVTGAIKPKTEQE